MMFWARRGIGTNLMGILVFGLLVVVLGAISIPVLRVIPSTYGQLLLYGCVALATWIVVRFFDRHTAVWIGLALHRRTARELSVGVALGAGAALIAWTPSALTGTVEINPTLSLSGLATSLMITTLLATGEEILFRGYLYQRIVEMIGPTLGTIIVAAAFAAAHLLNPGMTPLAGINLFLAGLLFSAAWIVTGSLWTSIGIHVAWNVVLADILGAATSGLTHAGSMFITSAADHGLINGGTFGPEGGIAATLALIAAGAVLYGAKGIGFSPYTFSRLFWEFYRSKREKAL